MLTKNIITWVSELAKYLLQLFLICKTILLITKITINIDTLLLAGIKFLEVLRPFISVIPEVSKPERKVRNGDVLCFFTSDVF